MINNINMVFLCIPLIAKENKFNTVGVADRLSLAIVLPEYHNLLA